MAGLELTGPLNLAGRLTLDASGGKVIVGGDEVLVQSSAPGGPHHGSGPPVILPPPPAPPPDTGPNVWVVGSFNQTVTVGTKPIVALGMVMQGNVPMWPGMMLPSQKNVQPTAVSVNGVPANILNDQAMIFPTGAPVSLGAGSGQ
jgi:hypothetical protein